MSSFSPCACLQALGKPPYSEATSPDDIVLSEEDLFEVGKAIRGVNQKGAWSKRQNNGLFNKIDTAHDGHITMEAFCAYYMKLWQNETDEGFHSHVRRFNHAAQDMLQYGEVPSDEADRPSFQRVQSQLE